MQKSLKDYNTFGIDARCRGVLEVTNLPDLRSHIAQFKSETIILGGGSNVLFAQELIDKYVLINKISGISVVEDNDEVLVKAGGGVVWNDLVKYCVENGYGGIENLSLIPGSVGAAPMQNIGAYGVELKDVFVALEALNLETLEVEEFDNSSCGFGYRTSVFKTNFKGKYFILSVSLRLSKKPVLKLDYGAIRAELEKEGITQATIIDVRNVVNKIRSSKLPDPSKIGNAGSFFKNPIIDKEAFVALRSKRNDVVFYPLANDKYKIPAGWLIEQCGWKGKQVGNTGCYVNQALVIVNYGNASGSEIYEHACRVQQSVLEEFGIPIDMEVNVIQ